MKTRLLKRPRSFNSCMQGDIMRTALAICALALTLGPAAAWAQEPARNGNASIDPEHIFFT